MSDERKRRKRHTAGGEEEEKDCKRKKICRRGESESLARGVLDLRESVFSGCHGAAEGGAGEAGMNDEKDGEEERRERKRGLEGEDDRIEWDGKGG